MLSRGFVSAASLLRASESRVFMASIRNVYTMNGRALRPVSSPLFRRMSNEEKRSTAETVQKIKKPLTLSEINDAGKKGSKSRHPMRTFFNVISWIGIGFEILPGIIVIALCLAAIKIVNEEECDVEKLILINEFIDILSKRNGNSTASATTDEESDSEASDN